MLSIGRLGVTSGAEYYLDTVANNVDDYYLGRGEAPGRWIGRTADQLGLVGQVDAESLRNLLAGLSAAGEPLGARLSADRRPGFDLTCSAPNVVTVVWAFGTDDTRDRITDAHDRAVGAVLDQLSTDAGPVHWATIGPYRPLPGTRALVDGESACRRDSVPRRMARGWSSI